MAADQRLSADGGGSLGTAAAPAAGDPFPALLSARPLTDCGERYCEVTVPSPPQPVDKPPTLDRAAVIVIVFLAVWLTALLIFELKAPRRVSQVTQKLSRAWKWFGAALLVGLGFLGWHLVVGGPWSLLWPRDFLNRARKHVRHDREK